MLLTGYDVAVLVTGYDAAVLLTGYDVAVLLTGYDVAVLVTGYDVTVLLTGYDVAEAVLALVGGFARLETVVGQLGVLQRLQHTRTGRMTSEDAASDGGADTGNMAIKRLRNSISSDHGRCAFRCTKSHWIDHSGLCSHKALTADNGMQS